MCEQFSSDDRVEIVRATSVEAAKNFTDEHFDAVYIDGDHRYEAVRADIDAWFPKIRNEGFLC